MPRISNKQNSNQVASCRPTAEIYIYELLAVCANIKLYFVLMNALAILVTIWALGFSAVALTITDNTVETIILDKHDEDLTVNSGAYYWLLNNNSTVLRGSVENNGGLYVSNFLGVVSDFTAVGPSFINRGSLDFNTLDAKEVSIYNITSSDTFENSGDMFFGVSGGTPIKTPFTITAATSWTNQGRIVFEKTSEPSVHVLVGKEIAEENGLRYIKNEGAICLYNTEWKQTTNVVGKGCITVGKNSKFQLQFTLNKLSLYFPGEQTINLAESDSSLEFTGLTQGVLATCPTFKVVGFGNGNTVKIDQYLRGFFYDTQTGILKIKLNGSSVLRLDIGRDYKPSKFKKAGTAGGSSISYRGGPPNNAPAICSCDKTLFESTMQN